ncbi:MAG: sodium:solute symporter family protein [Thermodesulfobacteriota bacterium]
MVDNRGRFRVIIPAAILQIRLCQAESGHPNLRDGFFYFRDRKGKEDMLVKISILGAYGLGLFLIGWWTRSHWRSDPVSYFLDNRGLGSLAFLCTMAATNFSAFTVFGVSGAGYRDGYAFYPIMGFGTGFMAITFWLIGRRVRELGRETGALTPPGLVRDLYHSPFLSFIFGLVCLVFTVPYLAMQPLAAGYALKGLLGLDQAWGVGLVTLVICIYTFQGGMKSVAWTDVFQGFIMLLVLALALVVAADQAGGLGSAGQRLLEKHPELFSRPGAQGVLTPQVWFSWMFLWFFCDPMFPQLFQRFLAARDNTAIRRGMLFYPAVCSIVFLLPVTIGVLGRLSHPGLTGREADSILPLLAAGLDSPVLGALVITCGLAALMSTMDSQLLTCSSIFSQDILPLIRRRPAAGAWPGRIFVLALSLAGCLMALRPPETMLVMAGQAFSGLAVLFPTVLFGLYSGWRSRTAAVVSILAGETALVLSFFGWLPTAGFLSAVPIVVVAFGVYLLAAGIERLRKGQGLSWPKAFLASPYTWAFAAVLVLAQDWWRWGRRPDLFWGWPAWVFYFLLLSAVQTWLMARWSRARV